MVVCVRPEAACSPSTVTLVHLKEVVNPLDVGCIAPRFISGSSVYEGNFTSEVQYVN